MPETIRLVDAALTQADTLAISEALQSTADGPRAAAEQALATATGQHEGVLCGSYEAAAILLLEASGIGPGHEVVTGGLLDARIEAAVNRVGARLVCVDVDPVHLGPSIDALEHAVTPATRAVLAGPVDGRTDMLDAVAAACVRQEVAFVELVGAWLGLPAGDRPIGARGWAALMDCGALCVHGVDRAGGIVTSDTTLTAEARSRLTSDGPAPCRPSRASTALLAARLDRLADTAEQCGRAAEAYIRTLAAAGQLALGPVRGTCCPRFVVRLDDTLAADERDEIIEGMHRHDIETAPAAHVPQTALSTCPRACGLAPRLLALPMHGMLEPTDATLVAQTLELMIERATFKRPDATR